jgi:hypothetical protein
VPPHPAPLERKEIMNEKEILKKYNLANLCGADLRGANLRGACGSYSIFYCGKYEAAFAGGKGSIGCEFHSYQHWLDHGVEIGHANGFTEEENSVHMKFIKLAVEHQRGIEKDDGSPLDWKE